MRTVLATAIATDGAAARAALTSTERTACSGLATAHQRSDFRAGRLAGKRATAELLGEQAGPGIELVATPHGPPRLALVDARGRRRDTPVHLSLSHRDGHGVAVVAKGGVRVGVDVERCGVVDRALARYFLTPAEQTITPDRDPTALWSLKEAAWKALGLGRSLPFKEMELQCEPGRWIRSVRVRGVSLPIHATLRAPWPGYLMATVWVAAGEA